MGPERVSDPRRALGCRRRKRELLTSFQRGPRGMRGRRDRRTTADCRLGARQAKHIISHHEPEDEIFARAKEALTFTIFRGLRVSAYLLITGLASYVDLRGRTRRRLWKRSKDLQDQMRTMSCGKYAARYVEYERT